MVLMLMSKAVQKDFRWLMLGFRHLSASFFEDASHRKLTVYFTRHFIFYIFLFDSLKIGA